eukprot:TRINITY_DN7322_c0_g1_i5.p4 TRINITY_DN7322_c0_g1~~TRINITY_DN7322_c0_g1_i5.p4  ORF type:complete len:106 (+),score=26.63 TRINITY_DN7322_c0_g1_i5:149-466(+)
MQRGLVGSEMCIRDRYMGKMKYLETSAKSSANVVDSFRQIATEVQQRISKKSGTTPTPSGKKKDITRGIELSSKETFGTEQKKKGAAANNILHYVSHNILSLIHI